METGDADVGEIKVDFKATGFPLFQVLALAVTPHLPSAEVADL
jgi:hypothetical protein